MARWAAAVRPSHCRKCDDPCPGRSWRLAFPGPGSDKDEACGNRLSRSKIIREVVENPCAVLCVDSHTVANHLLYRGVPTLAGQSGRSDDHAQVMTGLARAGHEVPIGPGR